MNYFFALEVPEKVRQKVADAAAEWKELLPPPLRAKWVEPQDYHITLKFLGDLPRSSEEALVDIAALIAGSTKPFPVQLLSFDAFDSLTQPRTLYISVQQDATRIDMTKHLHQRLTDIGYKLDQRPPRPHLTVARHCRQIEPLPWPGWPVPIERLFPVWQAQQFVLMQTLPPEQRAKEGKARYNIVHTFPFGEPPS